jgi:hypothetical protein
VASLPSYQLARNLNLALGWELIRGNDISWLNEQNQPEWAPYYQFDDVESHILYELVGNKGTQTMLPEQRNIDFILRIYDETEIFDTQPLFRKIQQVNGISFAIILDPKSLKNKNRIYFDQGEIPAF